MATNPLQRRPSTAPLSRTSNRAAEERFVGQWLANVEAGHIGSPTSCSPTAPLLEAKMSSQELATQRANEMAVLGHAPSFPSASERRLRGWRY